MQTIHLNPSDHRESVEAFFDFFKLPSQRVEVKTLCQILEAFAHIPYENISKIIKLHETREDEAKRIRLPEEVIENHISRKLGGTCFSLTYFLQSILTQNGFTCYPVMADMRAGPNIHCCLIVLMDGLKYLVDPGYLLTEPMELNPAKRKLYRSEFAGVELRRDASHRHYDLFTFDRRESKWRYRLFDRPVSPQEFLQHWLASFGRNSMHGICLTKVMKDGLVYIHNNFMRETTFGEKRNFNIRQTYHATINAAFGIDKEIVEQARAALQENMWRARHLGLWTPRETVGVS